MTDKPLLTVPSSSFHWWPSSAWRSPGNSLQLQTTCRYPPEQRSDSKSWIAARSARYLNISCRIFESGSSYRRHKPSSPSSIHRRRKTAAPKAGAIHRRRKTAAPKAGGGQDQQVPGQSSYTRTDSLHSSCKSYRDEQLEPHRSAAATGVFGDEVDECLEELIPRWPRRPHQASAAGNIPHVAAAADTGEAESSPTTAEPTAAEEKHPHRWTKKVPREQKKPP